MPTARSFWEDLFAAPEESGQGIRVEMSLLKKRGQPLLLLPGQARPAAATMDLYPAQTGRARAARMLLRWLLRASLPLGTRRVSLTISRQDPFVAFLSSLVGGWEWQLPAFGIFAGNPASDGQRFLLLVFNSRQRPIAVVKAGLSQRARALIQQEANFLAAAPAETVAAPRLQAQFESPRLRALAIAFFPGDSPRPQDEAALPSVLNSWVDPKRTIAVADAPDWRRLQEAAPGSGLFAALAGPLGGRKLHPAIHHGDFVPWNIRVSPVGTWTVLDWERGELAGIPGWDWFHYLIQSGILVGRLSVPVLIQRVEALLDSEPFKQYAVRAGIQGCERELVLAYLLHIIEVIKPSEGLTATAELLQALSTRWRKA